MYGLASLFPHSKLNSQKQASAHDAPSYRQMMMCYTHICVLLFWENYTCWAREKKVKRLFSIRGKSSIPSCHAESTMDGWWNNNNGRWCFEKREGKLKRFNHIIRLSSPMLFFSLFLSWLTCVCGSSWKCDILGTVWPCFRIWQTYWNLMLSNDAVSFEP